MTLRVAVDATPLLGHPTGVGTMTRALLTRLGADPSVDVRAFAVTWRGRGLLADTLPAGVVPITRPMAARPLRALWRRLGRPAVERWTGPVDLVHGPNFVVPPARAAARLVTVHDLTAIRFPELCTRDVLAYPDLLRRSVASGAWVHVPSAAVGREVVEHLGVDPARVVAVHNGVDEVGAAPAGAGRSIAGHDRYVLALGTLEPRKDLPSLVAAFDAVAATDPDLGLVLAGDEGWGADAVHAAVAAAAHRDRIVLSGWVDGGQRAALLRDAAVLAYPSLYEGFGLPPLEAMSVGVPVVATTAGALPEVLGGGADLVPPHDPAALAGALARVLDDDRYRKALIGRGDEQVRRYHWDRHAAEMVALYHRVVESGRSGAP